MGMSALVTLKHCSPNETTRALTQSNKPSNNANAFLLNTMFLKTFRQISFMVHHSDPDQLQGCPP